ncbi:KTSC domain-containing protein [Sulfuricystis multivorans]|uniref:KTSC domain-containing protein n=1 Tax=Sulfuricystis multivorans TaxID=2211108 RepID=UPI000F83F009|nr:KTSC domain-containing protein [Sulfuricystis multivorans]
MHPNLTPVSSSNIDGYLYLADRKILLIAFKNGGVYAYEDVEQPVVTEFAQASSKGKFFQSNIRDRYTTSKLDDMAVANLLGGMDASVPHQSRRKAPRVTLQSLLLRYPMLNAVF